MKERKKRGKTNKRINVKPKQRAKLNVDLVMLLACRATVWNNSLK
jgi:hypothetical protein